VERGFKAWCERIAEKYRQQLGIDKAAPLCAWRLADHLKVLVWKIEDIPGIPSESLTHLTTEGSGSWSAATLFHEDQTLVILNSAHTPERTSNNLMHELAHIICGHKPIRVDVSEDGHLVLQSYAREQEEEADCLAAVLLLPRVALVAIKRSSLANDAIAKQYSVSKQLLQMRLNVSGVNKQFRER
jgi:Zn-dependent peptidase ImmA (M78 family)